MFLTDEQRKLVEDNIKLAGYMTFKWIRKGVGYSSEEIFSLFSLALCKAGATFNPNKGVRFSTYAARCMENELKMAFRVNNPIQITEFNSITVEDENREPLDIFEILPNNDHLKYDEVINSIFLIEALKTLKPRDLEVIKMRFFYEDTQDKIANRFKISRSYVSRLEKTILRKLYRWSRNKGIS